MDTKLRSQWLGLFVNVLLLILFWHLLICGYGLFYFRGTWQGIAVRTISYDFTSMTILFAGMISVFVYVVKASFDRHDQLRMAEFVSYKLILAIAGVLLVAGGWFTSRLVLHALQTLVGFSLD